MMLLVRRTRRQRSQRCHDVLLERSQEAVEQVQNVVVYFDGKNDSQVTLLYQLRLKVLQLVRLVVPLDEGEESLAVPPLRKALLYSLQVLDLQWQLDECLVQDVVHYLLLVSVLDDSVRWRSKQLLWQL